MKTPTRQAATSTALRVRLSEAIRSGYLIDDGYGSRLAEMYHRWCWHQARPLVRIFPWRRLWVGLELVMAPGFLLTQSAVSSLKESASRAQDRRWGTLCPATFTSYGGEAFGLDPERAEELAQTVARSVLDPGATSPPTST
jgi:hypothetical protein